MVDPSPESTEAQEQPSTAVPRKIRWKSDQRKRVKRKAAVSTASPSSEIQDASPPASGTGSPSHLEKVSNTVSNGHLADADEVDDVVDCTHEMALVRTPNAFVVPWIAPINSQTRMLMSHCEFYPAAPFGEHSADSNSCGRSRACHGRIGYCKRLS